MRLDWLHATLALVAVMMAFWPTPHDEPDTYAVDRLTAQCAAYHDDVTALIFENAKLAAHVRRLEETMRPLMRPVD